MKCHWMKRRRSLLKIGVPTTATKGEGRLADLCQPIVTRSAEQSELHAQQMPESYTSASFYSLNPSDLTATPPTPVPIHFHAEGPDQSQSPPQSMDHSPERQGITIPWTNSSDALDFPAARAGAIQARSLPLPLPPFLPFHAAPSHPAPLHPRAAASSTPRPDRHSHH